MTDTPRGRDWVGNCSRCPTDHWPVQRNEGHRRVTRAVESSGYTCRCGFWAERLDTWHDHLTGTETPETRRR